MIVYELTHELDALFLVQLARQGNFDLEGGLPVFAFDARFNGVPKCFTLGQLGGHVTRQPDLFVLDVTLAGVVVCFLFAHIGEPFARTIGRSGDSGASL